MAVDSGHEKVESLIATKQHFFFKNSIRCNLKRGLEEWIDISSLSTSENGSMSLCYQ